MLAQSRMILFFFEDVVRLFMAWWKGESLPLGRLVDGGTGYRGAWFLSMSKDAHQEPGASGAKKNISSSPFNQGFIYVFVEQ